MKSNTRVFLTAPADMTATSLQFGLEGVTRGEH